MAQQRIISADSHFVEPPEMWAKYMDARFRDHAPHIEEGYKGRPGQWFMCENIQPIQVGGFFGSGKSAEELPEHVKKGFEAAPKSVWDPAERLKEQDRDGVSAEALYTSMGMLLFGLDNAELRTECFRAFNDWAADYCSYDPKRLVGLGAITLEDIPAGVAELERIAKKGLRGALIWGSPPEDKLYSSPEYDPFWAAAQEHNFPLSLHILTGRAGNRFSRRKVLFGYMRLPQEIQLTIADMITGGVFQRFPRLKIVSAENDVSWIPHFMYRIDHAYDRLRHLEGLTLPMLPSEYMRQNVWATFQFETSTVAFTSQAYSPERMMWSSDYPHTDSPWPHSREFIAEALKGISADDAAKITSKNAAQLYGIA